MVKEISLSGGHGNKYVTLVDDEDYNFLSQFTWGAKYDPCTKKYYARLGVSKKWRHIWGSYTVSLHRLVINANKGDQVDHINGDTLDNRRCNLRICTHSENKCNSKMRCDNKSGYRGVRWNTDCNKWFVSIGPKTKIPKLGYLGIYDDKIVAALVYDEAADKYHGEYKKLNFPAYSSDVELFTNIEEVTIHERD